MRETKADHRLGLERSIRLRLGRQMRIRDLFAYPPAMSIPQTGGYIPKATRDALPMIRLKRGTH